MKNNEVRTNQGKKHYEPAELVIIIPETEDVISTSGFSGEDDPLTLPQIDF